MLSYGYSADAVNEYVHIGDTTHKESLKEFCRAVVKKYGETYLRDPNAEDVKRIMAINKKRGFPGMLGSLDYIHWEWKNCPTAWHGIYKGKEKTATVVLEAVATQDL